MTHAPLTPTEARVASLLDLHLDGVVTEPALVDRLRSIWGTDGPLDAEAATDALRSVLGALRAAVEPYRERLAGDCTWCWPHEMCARHRQQVYAWKDVVEEAAREVLHEVPAQARLEAGAR